MSELKRKKNESFEAFIRRVKQTWQRSGNILQARKIQYFTPAKSKNVTRNQSISRAKLISKTDYLRKTGKLPADDKKDKRNRR
ncbi:hypothetical protein HOF40_01095 [Candidatus Parcubacteria bacterium]|jgi:ribosomal protein S21|nr:hypothetical protein [Candidatus Parcubacteria bacterium]MBT3948665.1 hypothetical protein [Candidatus Parcubacteria bacterium]